MAEHFEIRALYDKDTITMYQSYNQEIARKACENHKFIEPFSFNRMTWIKPSFLWLMERSHWGHKANQEATLAIKLKRHCFENALLEAVLTSPEQTVYKNPHEWEILFNSARVHVQWDPERDVRGKKLNYRSIQIGISRHLIKEFNDNWIIGIEDRSALVKKIYNLKQNGDHSKANALLPKERVYVLPNDIKKRLGMK